MEHLFSGLGIPGTLSTDCDKNMTFSRNIRLSKDLEQALQSSQCHKFVILGSYPRRFLTGD
jgi:hypothetical protein